MRKFPIFIIILFIACVAIFIGSFVYLDHQKRDSFNYIYSLNNHDIGTIKIDCFSTEEKLIFKSSSEMPFYPIYTQEKVRMAFDRKYDLESYLSESSGSGAEKSFYVERTNTGFSTLTVASSRFCYTGNLPSKYKTFVFDEKQPVTYLPLIHNFDFKRGKSQGFSAITPFSDLLPPARRFVTLTSVRNEYLKIDRRKIKTECLLLKIKGYPQGTVWVAKADRSLVMIELPMEGIRIRRSFKKVKVESKGYELPGETLSSRDVTFGSKNIKLAGTVVSQKKGARHPAVILVWGDGNEDRYYKGIFSNLSKALARNGFTVLSFDKRGVGSSEGNSQAVRDADIRDDVNAAIDFIKTDKDADPAKIVLMSHAEGVYHALNAASTRDDVKAIVILSPSTSPAREKNAETLDMAMNTKGEWATILGKKCFVENIRTARDPDVIALAKTTKTPVLIIKGNQDDISPAGSEVDLEDALKQRESGIQKLIYLSYLGHYLGSMVLNGENKMGYVIDSGVVDSIKTWLDKALAEPPAPRPEPVPEPLPAPAPVVDQETRK